MEIQITEEGIARWQCKLCDDEMMWLEYRQLPLWMWPTSAGSSKMSTHSGSAVPPVHELENDDQMNVIG
eukprot:4045597-Heterocapsa_arctica.AAC.1